VDYRINLCVLQVSFMDENLHRVFICKSYEDAKKMFANYCRDEWLKDLENRPQLVIDCMGLPPDNNDSVIAQWTFVNPYLTAYTRGCLLDFQRYRANDRCRSRESMGTTCCSVPC
jgi:hypothetical protein